MHRSTPVLPGANQVAALAALVIDRSWGARLSRGWALAKASILLMREQPGMLAVPVITSAAVLAAALLAVGLDSFLPAILQLLVLAGLFVIVGGVGAVGQGVIVYRVMMVIQGGAVTNSQAFAAVKPKLGALTKWGVLTLTVGALIRTLERGRGPIGLLLRVVAIFLAIGWSAMTFFVIPVILFENLGVKAAMTRSREIVRGTWGEGVVGVGALNALFNIVGLATIVFCVVLIEIHLVALAVIIFVAALITLNLLAAVASPVFVAVLYNFANVGQVALGLDPQQLAAAFRPKRRRPQFA